MQDAKQARAVRLKGEGFEPGEWKNKADWSWRIGERGNGKID